MIGVGIIGTGYIAAAAHGPVVMASRDAHLAAVLSRQEAAGREFLAGLGADDARAYDDLGAFLGDPRVELVIVASPDGLHFPQAEASLRAGKHVLVEKPMALSVAEARTLVDLAATQDRVLAASYHLRCHPGHVALRERVRAGELGTIRHLRLIWAYPIPESNWRARGDVGRWWSMSATATHCLDLARWFAGDVADWAQYKAVLSTARWHTGRDETAAIAGQLASGPTVEVLSTVQVGEYTRLEIFGDGGTAFCDGTFGPDGTGEIVLNGRRLDFTPVSPFVPQLAALLAAVKGQGPPPADGAVGLRAVEDLVLADDR
ncbi:Gfo/Idh/MocA family oxidoreductase [Asanoa sp. WMMD1127]|uniref:Gfo/Idh/MocA family protein n=1 Tax=Asanoa sp. WMMD1127 TaxID=3016107 RepID=UPI002416C4B7|nr:Gfo/Idh/MocA family oxidoreductase [Asanoa sp. WMMD1127]MDG4825832.1 Gfo/Idh/MocA family oxidoreductase [Asanoa sp. WMMD1127]